MCAPSFVSIPNRLCVLWSIEVDDGDAGTAKLYMFVAITGDTRDRVEVLADDLAQHAGARAVQDAHPAGVELNGIVDVLRTQLRNKPGG